jgi:GntR family transcriptional repressor for pyruvate dehydrogenase complex
MHRFGANNDSSLVSKVCTRLAAMMRSPAFTATDKLPPERILAQKLGVSRTVMREATKRLESQGLLEIRHGSGIRIVNELHRPVCGSLSLAMPAPQERLRQLNEARLLVEPEIARQAAERRSNAHLRALAKSQSDLFNALNNALNTLDAVEADIAFHRALADAAGNEVFKLMLESMAELGRVSRRSTIGTVGKEKAYSQHARILLAVEAGDGDVAAKEMRAHLRHAYADLCKTTKTK